MNKNFELPGIAILGWILLFGPLSCFGESFPVEFIAPNYPRIARLSQLEGVVKVRAKMDPLNGRLILQEEPMGHFVLVDEIKRTLASWKFGSCRTAGEGEINLSFAFRLTEANSAGPDVAFAGIGKNSYVVYGKKLSVPMID